jgi:hypothetical protein
VRSSQYTIPTTWKLGLRTGGHAYSTFASRPWYSYKAPFAYMVFFPCLTCSQYARNCTLSCTSKAMGPGPGVCIHVRLREARRVGLGKQFGQLQPDVHLFSIVTVRHAETSEATHASFVLCGCNRSATRKCLFEPARERGISFFLAVADESLP